MCQKQIIKLLNYLTNFIQFFFHNQEFGITKWKSILQQQQLSLFYYFQACLGEFLGKSCDIVRDLKGQVIVITGGNAGIGEETTKVLASMGATVIIAARDTTKSQAVLSEIGQKFNTTGYAVSLDLSDLSSIRDCVSTIKLLELGKVDILINNAGMMGTQDFQLTKQGFEKQFTTNYLGPFYFTQLLVPLLKKSSSPRIINVSSELHRQQQTDFGDIQNLSLQENYGFNSGLRIYYNTKYYNILHAMKLEEKYGIKGCSLHPGVVRTGIAQTYMNSKIKQFFFCLIYPCFAFFTRNTLQGAQTSLQCTLMDINELQSGEYYNDCKVSEPTAATKEKAEQLWQITERLLQNGLQSMNL